MKRFLLTTSIAALAMGALSSCQKEDKSSLELAQELTAELQKVVDYKTAEAAAPRVEAINQRFQHASVRPLALNGTALLRASQTGNEEYAKALVDLAKEIARVQASLPVTESGGEVDRDELMKAVGVAQGGDVKSSAAARKAVAAKYFQNDSDKTHSVPGNFADYYGSSTLKSAVEYTVTNAEISTFEGEVPAIPDPVAPAEEPADEKADAPVAGEPSTEEPAAEEPATEEPTDAEPTTESGGEESQDSPADGGGSSESVEDGGEAETSEEDSLEIDF